MAIRSEEHYALLHLFFLYPIGYIIGLLARRMHLPAIATLVRGDVKRYLFSPEKVAVCRGGLGNADRILALSHDLVAFGDALTPIAHKSRVIHNAMAIPSDGWQPKRERAGPFVIGAAGIFKYAKGLP